MVIVKDYNDLPEKGEDNAYYVVVNEQKLYSYDSYDNKYKDTIIAYTKGTIKTNS